MQLPGNDTEREDGKERNLYNFADLACAHSEATSSLSRRHFLIYVLCAEPPVSYLCPLLAIVIQNAEAGE